MQIPSSFKPYREKTLLVVTDSTQAQLYLLDQIDVQFLEKISTKLVPDHGQDRVSIKLGGGGHASGEQHEHLKEWTREELYHALSKNLMHRLQKKEFETLVFTVPAEEENELKETLHIDLLKRSIGMVPKLLTHEELPDILGHVEEIR